MSTRTGDPRRLRRRAASSMKVEQSPHLLSAFDDACVMAFRRYFRFDPPKAVVVRAFERVLIAMATEIEGALPGIGSIYNTRPQPQDRESWEQIELEIAQRLLKMWRNRELRTPLPRDEQEPNAISA